MFSFDFFSFPALRGVVYCETNGRSICRRSVGPRFGLPTGRGYFEFIMTMIIIRFVNQTRGPSSSYDNERTVWERWSVRGLSEPRYVDGGKIRSTLSEGRVAIGRVKVLFSSIVNRGVQFRVRGWLAASCILWRIGTQNATFVFIFERILERVLWLLKRCLVVALWKVATVARALNFSRCLTRHSTKNEKRVCSLNCPRLIRKLCLSLGRAKEAFEVSTTSVWSA